MTLQIFQSDLEVQQFAEEKSRKIIIFEGFVYDISSYMNLHPGGSQILEPLIRKSIDDEFSEVGHSRSAKQLFLEFQKVGIISSPENSLNQSTDETTEEEDKDLNKACEAAESLDGKQLTS